VWLGKPHSKQGQAEGELPARRKATLRVGRIEGWSPLAQVSTEPRLQGDSPSPHPRSRHDYDRRVEIPDAIEPVIHCERLDLHHLAANELIALHADVEDSSIYESHVYRNPHRVLVDGPSPVHWRVPQVIDNPSSNKWFIRWMVLRATNEIIGSLSFHAPPDDAGMLEIGLGVHEKFQRQGFAREALTAMWLWACSQPGVRTLRYTVDPHNEPSVQLVRSFHFTHVGQQIDEIDGPEDIFEKRVEDFRRLHAPQT
jgi:ribosomal-protein-alanine N-acetyltransferase